MMTYRVTGQSIDFVLSLFIFSNTHMPLIIATWSHLRRSVTAVSLSYQMNDPSLKPSRSSNTAERFRCTNLSSFSLTE